MASSSFMETPIAPSVTTPNDEARRLKDLHNLRILDTPPNPLLDEITKAASLLFRAPIVAVSFVDEKRQWLKSKVGTEMTENAREHSFCSHTIQKDGVMVVTDATQDQRFSDHPMVKGEPHIRFYAGAPLVTRQGSRVGALCVLDRAVREFNAEERGALQLLAKQVMEQVEPNRELFVQWDNLSELLSAGIVTEDKDHLVSYVSPELYRIFDVKPLPESAFLGKRPSELWRLLSKHTQFPERFESRANQIRRDCEQTMVSYSQVIDLDEEKSLRCSVGPTCIAGNSFGYVWTFTDVSAHRKNDRVIESLRMQIAESAKLRVLGEMAGGIAHEINNVLTIIQTRAFHIKQLASLTDVDAQRVVDFSEKIQSAVDRVIKIVKGVNNISRDEQVEELLPISVDSLIHETLAFCEERLKNFGIQLELPSSGGEICFKGRLIQASQVLLNLINNAIDALLSLRGSDNPPAKRIRIQIHQSDGFVYLCVIDSGAGVSEYAREQLFRPFYTTKKGDKGTGLGLNISRRIMNSFGGDLYLEADTKETVFVMRFCKA